VNAAWSLSALVLGLVAGVVTLVVLAVRAALAGQAGPTFADLWTALAVGVAIAAVSLVFPKLIEWQLRRGVRVGSDRGMHFIHESPAVGGQAASFSGSRDSDRFDKFTDSARKVLTLSQDEAMRFNHPYIGTEHLLLGLVRESEGVAARVLANMDVELAKVRTVVEFIIGRGDQPVAGEVGLTPRAKRVIELAIDEARKLGHHYIGTEHLLLGLLVEGQGIAAGVLDSLGVQPDRTRAEVLRVLSAGGDVG
jgi:hypothetical protein